MRNNRQSSRRPRIEEIASPSSSSSHRHHQHVEEPGQPRQPAMDHHRSQENVSDSYRRSSALFSDPSFGNPFGSFGDLSPRPGASAMEPFGQFGLSGDVFGAFGRPRPFGHSLLGDMSQLMGEGFGGHGTGTTQSYSSTTVTHSSGGRTVSEHRDTRTNDGSVTRTSRTRQILTPGGERRVTERREGGLSSRDLVGVDEQDVTRFEEDWDRVDPLLGSRFTSHHQPLGSGRTSRTQPIGRRHSHRHRQLRGPEDLR
eukprot:gnl/Dysnectes_brevis/4078_a5347_956.p1 GENE.gnl/Dysnectes_brevis/4078_a5347_956~~gnl/Dysnectes_brevis/4078_a5347_956.p1  ORF type:complete len:256 (+),score=12.66 gnl/Dysnectes_brevis/4078_a5347_956:182-949(+)